MEKTSSNLFKDGIDKAFSKLGSGLNQSTMADAIKYKQSFTEENLEGGVSDKLSMGDLAKKHKVDITYLRKQLERGIKTEMEHTRSKKTAKEIAMDHLSEDPKYYVKLSKIESNEATGSGSSGAFEGPLFGGDSNFLKKSTSETPKLKESMSDADTDKVEAKEATTSGSVGGYQSPSMWAKSTKKKDWGPSRKAQIPGGSFVKVKKKCTKFPYCNQGDINALKISKNESVKEAIKSISNKLGISESVIVNILEQEYSKLRKR